MERNFKILKEFIFNLNRVLNFEKNLITAYNSEFEDPKLLEELFHYHPRWIIYKQNLKNGVSFSTSNISESNRLRDIIAALKRGNHKSALKHSKFIKKCLFS